MEIVKEIKSKIDQDYFFIKGNINIDSEYFIEKIKKGCSEKDNMNFKTNIIGSQTSWQYFNKDLKFNKILFKFLDYIDLNFSLPNYTLVDAWGFECSLGSRTITHDHFPSLISGVIYLNEHSQLLEFKDINQTVKPEKGSFALFSGFLKHGCFRNKQDAAKYGLSFNLNLIK